MQKTILTPSSDVQLQHWIEKLKAANVEYDVITKDGKAVLELLESHALGVLGVNVKKETPSRQFKWYHYLLFGSIFFWVVALIVPPVPDSEPEPIQLTAEEQIIADSLATIQARKELIEKQFSAWDGSHNNLTRLIKKGMNDPSSYDHVQTNYWDMGDHLVVKTSFRGNNAFGGKVLNSVRAEVGLDGSIISIEQE